MARPLFVSEDKWNDAVKFLTGLGANPTLTKADQRRLRESMRGPFAKGMTEQQAERMLREAVGWEKQ